MTLVIPNLKSKSGILHAVIPDIVANNVRNN